MNPNQYELQRIYAKYLLDLDQQRITKFPAVITGGDIWLDGKLVCENGEIIQ